MHDQNEIKRLHGALDKAKEENRGLRLAIDNLASAIPAISRRMLIVISAAEVPTYDCPMRVLALAMNEAARLLGKKLPYPGVVGKQAG